MTFSEKVMEAIYPTNSTKRIYGLHSYYDEQTGLYYLKSRYYDSDIGRFINADDPSVLDLTNRDLNGYNLYTFILIKADV